MVSLLSCHLNPVKKSRSSHGDELVIEFFGKRQNLGLAAVQTCVGQSASGAGQGHGLDPGRVCRSDLALSALGRQELVSNSGRNQYFAKKLPEQVQTAKHPEGDQGGVIDDDWRVRH
jgi:hypothetical protein